MADELRFFVASDGNDQASGLEPTAARGGHHGPFASLERARDAVRAARRGRGPLPAHIVLGPGVYPLRAGLTLGAEDSGSAAAPLVIEAAQPGSVRLTGGLVLDGWRPVSDPAALGRLPPAARAHVLEIDLAARGVNEVAPMLSRGFGRPVAAAGPELFWRGEPLTLARWPNEGFVTIAGFPSAGATPDGHGGSIGGLEAGFQYEGERPRAWREPTEAWVHGYWAWDWANSYEQVAAIDLEQRLIRTRKPFGLYGFRKGQRFHFLNILEELDAPGEWYLDRAACRLYVWPPAPPAPGDAVLSLLAEPLVTVTDAAHVTLRGLVLECGRRHGIEVRGGTGVRIEQCELRNLGNYGVWIAGGTAHAVRGCVLFGTGDGGIHVSGGDRRTLTPAGHEVSRNHIHHVGRWSRCYVPAVLLDGVGIRVANNLIHDHPHCAILFAGNEHRIERNEIHHVCLETGDVGAVYAGRDWTYRGNAVRHNFIHHTGGVGMGSMGIYNDDCLSGTLMEGNVFWKVQRAAFLGGGRDHRVVNNIFVDCTPAVWLDGRGLDKAPVWHNMVYQTLKQRLEAVNWRQPPYSARYPELAALAPYYAGTDGVPPEHNLAERNICWGGTWVEATWHSVGHHLRQERNLVGVDPLFVDAAAGDFRLRPDSPAWALGFEPIPFAEIGLGRPPATVELPAR